MIIFYASRYYHIYRATRTIRMSGTIWTTVSGKLDVAWFGAHLRCDKIIQTSCSGNDKENALKMQGKEKSE